MAYVAVHAELVKHGVVAHPAVHEQLFCNRGHRGPVGFEFMLDLTRQSSITPNYVVAVRGVRCEQRQNVL